MKDDVASKTKGMDISTTLPNGTYIHTVITVVPGTGALLKSELDNILADLTESHLQAMRGHHRIHARSWQSKVTKQKMR